MALLQRSHIVFAGLFLLAACTKTPDPDYLPEYLAAEKTAPWEAEIYSANELATFFPDENYTGLKSIYVSPKGSSNGDGSAARPYSSIQAAIDQHQGKGTIIRVRQGTYREPIKVTTTAATKEAPFVIYAEDGPGTVVINGEGKDKTLVTVQGQYIVIDGLTVKNTGEYGVLFGTHGSYKGQGGFKSYGVLRNATVHTTGRDAVKCGHVDYMLIEKNDISNVTNKIQSDNCIDGVACYHTLCRYNYIHDNSKGHGGYFKGGSANNIWHGNIFKNIGADNVSLEHALGAGLQLGGTGQGSHRDDAWYDYPAGYEQLVFNNLFINCKTAGILVVTCWKARIYNNSFYNCGKAVAGNSKTAIIRVMDGEFANQPNKEIDIYNNVFYNTTAAPLDVFYANNTGKFESPDVRHGYNMGATASGQVVWSFPDGNTNNDKAADPLFIDPENDNLEVRSNSPAIDSGTELPEVTFDHNGTPRPQGSATDRGAYEK